MGHPAIRLVHSHDSLPTAIKRFARCALPSAPTPKNLKNSLVNSPTLLERHASTFTRLHDVNPRLADLIEGMTQRYLAEELQWPHEE